MLPERFWGHVVKTEGCWLWAGAWGPRGYGRFQIAKVRKMAHVWAYEDVAGPVPAGMELDHLCRNHACVNPAHLEAVSHLVNMQRAVYPKGPRPDLYHALCKRGHDLAEAVTRMHRGRMTRSCPYCERERNRAYRARLAAQRVRRDPASRTHCPKGHPYDATNTRYDEHGWRYCRQCHRDRERERKRQRQGASAPVPPVPAPVPATPAVAVETGMRALQVAFE